MNGRGGNMKDLGQQDFVRVKVLQSVFEGQQAEALLKEAGIDCMVVSYHDTAMDGIYQEGKGWGEIRVPESRKAQAEEALAEGLKDLGGISEDEVAVQALKETLHDDGPVEESSSLRWLWWVSVALLGFLVALWAMKRFG
jgi:hypothetical protein